MSCETTFFKTSTGHVKLEWITSDAQHEIAKCARVSNPANQENRETESKLLKYLVNHKHWSPFEMASLCVEIQTNRAISAQILRHRSFSFQEFSQRYAQALHFQMPLLRHQDDKNRQNSLDTVTSEEQQQLQDEISTHLSQSFELYEKLISKGIAKESARFVLPLCTTTSMFMTGTIRSWIHYIQVRGHPDTQQEHREIALAVRQILINLLPSLELVLSN
jgi:thymidylate synthase (FAD)